MPTIEVTVVYSPASRVVQEVVLQLPEGSTVAQALAATAWFGPHPGALAEATPHFSIWGRRTTPEHILHHGDRLEGLRPLKVDPKEARRQRFVQQGSRAAGLFARRRAGAKPGY
jgi:putative ubiquitin-RnfH superfamily antitoxin RatB of RatAB toxin-antitoxin module